MSFENKLGERNPKRILVKIRENFQKKVTDLKKDKQKKNLTCVIQKLSVVTLP